MNRPLDAGLVAAIGKLFVEVIIAPAVMLLARELLAAKPNLRVLEAGGMPAAGAPGMSLRSVAGGYLLQGATTAASGAPISRPSRSARRASGSWRTCCSRSASPST